MSLGLVARITSSDTLSSHFTTLPSLSVYFILFVECVQLEVAPFLDEYFCSVALVVMKQDPTWLEQSIPMIAMFGVGVVTVPAQNCGDLFLYAKLDPHVFGQPVHFRR